MLKRQLCRLCLSHTPLGLPLLEGEIQMVAALTSIELSTASANHLNVICIKCRLNLKLAYTFQQSVIEANQNFSQKCVDEDHSTFEKVAIKEEQNEEVCDGACFICGLRIGFLHSHAEKHFQEEQYCDLCDKTFADIAAYRQHLGGHPFSDLYQCLKCGFSFQYKSFYNKHLESFHKQPRIEIPVDKPKQSFTCDLCSKVSNTKSGHLHHMLNHKTKPCPVCNKVLAAGSMRQHMEIHSDSPQMCEICGSTLKNKSSLRVHLRYSHKKERYPCEECGKIFKKKINLNQHKNTHQDPKYVCETCGKKFYSQHRLNIHIRMTHMKLRPFSCEYCKKAFSSKFALTTHKRQHTNETPYRCDVCGEGFRQNVSLKGHKKSKHNIEEPKTCKCSICGKAFASEWALKTHCRTH